MKYTTQIIINLPRKRVIELFDSMDNMYKWQPGLKNHEFVEGAPGEAGSKTRLVYDSRKGELAMLETIIKKNLPEEFHATYEARGVYNEMVNYFSEEGPDKTIWKTYSVFKFRGVMAIMARFMSLAFKKQTMVSMEQFKQFCEKESNP